MSNRLIINILKILLKQNINYGKILYRKKGGYMQKDEAIKSYISHNSKAMQVIHRIQLWDSSKSLMKNAMACGFSCSNAALQMARKYELKYVDFRK